MASSTSPNAIKVLASVALAMRRRRPRPGGMGKVDHDLLAPVLDAVAAGGVSALAEFRSDIAIYRNRLEQIDPDTLTRNEALAYWLNLYNAGVLDFAAEADSTNVGTVLQVPAAFTRRWVTIAGERLPLHEIEHAKVRRFKDPHIHGALVCGSASCPTLQSEPYTGNDLEEQLEDQMAAFLRNGAATVDRSKGELSLSRIFLWYGPDLARPGRMPAWLPATHGRLYRGRVRWLDPGVREWVEETSPKITFQPYDWSLGCGVR